MAAVKNVVLSIAPGVSAGTRKVSVAYRLSFDAAERGRPFEVHVELFGEDLVDDDEEPSDSAKPAVSFGFPFGPKAVIGNIRPKDFTDIREVVTPALNEDPGTTVIHPEFNTTVVLPHIDEIFAKVTIATKPVSARSATLSGVFF